jgi:hypothetical protein
MNQPADMGELLAGSPAVYSSMSFLGVRVRPASNFAAEITTGSMSCWLGTFDSADEVVLARHLRFGR